MYHPGNWWAWLSDGMAHANFVCALWCCALTFRAHRLPRRDESLAWGCAAACVLNAVLVVIHVRIWQWRMGL